MKKLDYWIFEEYQFSKEHLGIFRIVFMLYMLLLGMPSYAWIARNPDFLYNPPIFSLAVLLDSFPPALFFHLLDIGIYVSVVFVLFGYYTRSFSILLTLIQIIACHFAFSFGKIDHSILFVLTPLIMGLAGWGSAFSFDAQYRSSVLKPVSGYYISLLALIIGFGYFSAGYVKWVNGWVDFDIKTNATLSWAMMTYYVEERAGVLGYWFVTIKSNLFWEALDYITVFMELAMIFSIIKKEIFQVALLILTLFHIVIYLTIGISFFIHLIIFSLFLPWQKLLKANQAELILKRVIQYNYFLITLALVAPFYFIASIYLSMPSAMYCVQPIGILFDLVSWDYYSFVQHVALLVTIILLLITYKLNDKQNI